MYKRISMNYYYYHCIESKHTHTHKYISKHVPFCEFVFGSKKKKCFMRNECWHLFVRSYRPSFGWNVTGDYKTAHWLSQQRKLPLRIMMLSSQHQLINDVYWFCTGFCMISKWNGGLACTFVAVYLARQKAQWDNPIKIFFAFLSPLNVRRDHVPDDANSCHCFRSSCFYRFIEAHQVYTQCHAYLYLYW